MAIIPQAEMTKIMQQGRMIPSQALTVSQMMTPPKILQQAYERAVTNDSTSNYEAIREGFAAKGIAPEDIEPRVNVLTAKAWEYKGRKVLNAEINNGVRIKTRIPVEIEVDGDEGEKETKKINKRSRTVVYHISQTIDASENDPTPPPESEAEKVERVTARYTKSGKGLNLLFPNKPVEGIRKLLHSGGWKWHRKKEYWYCKLTEETLEFAQSMVRYFDGVFLEPDNEPDPDGTGGGKPETKTDSINPEKIQGMIERLEERAEEKLNPATAQQNPTPRRMRIIEGMRRDGWKLKDAALILRAILALHQQGDEIPEELASIKSMKDAEELARNISPENMELCRRLEYSCKSQEELEREAREEKEQEIASLERELIGMKMPGFFPTPTNIIDTMLEIADIQPNDIVLEPSAGKGDILFRAAEKGWRVDYCEWFYVLREIIAKRNEIEDHTIYNLGIDFMDVPLGTCRYDKILMNPPFESRQDAAHIMKAYDHLKVGGVLVAICGAGSVTCSDKKASEFQDWLNEIGAEVVQMDEGSFKSGFVPTGVNTFMITIEK